MPAEENRVEMPYSNWQQARVLYNQGVSYLFKGQPNKALSSFLEIIPTDLSLPQFGRDLFLNVGIANLQYAQVLEESSPWRSFEQRAFFIRQSLRALEEAHQLDTQIKEEEGGCAVCPPYISIRQWKSRAQLQEEKIEEQRRQSWIEEASANDLADFLFFYLKMALEHFEAIQSDKTSLDKGLMSYIRYQMNSFLPIWDAIGKKRLLSGEHAIWQEAKSLYINALAPNSNNGIDWKEVKQAMAVMGPLTFDGEEQVLKRVRWRTELFILRHKWTLKELEDLLIDWERLMPHLSNEEGRAIAQELELSLNNQRKGHIFNARFYLLAALELLESSIDRAGSSALDILQRAQKYAVRTLHSSFIANERYQHQAEEIMERLQHQQQSVLKAAELFIPAVLKEQENQFHRGGALSCRQLMWERVISLFYQGVKAARYARKELALERPVWASVLAAQEYTANVWRQAVELMLNPPQLASDHSQPIQEVRQLFRLIQEMYVEDEVQPVRVEEEWHAW